MCLSTTPCTRSDEDVGRFMNAATVVHDLEPTLRPGLSEIIAAIRSEAGLFVLEERGEPVATAICVHDGDLAGLFEIATGPRERGKGMVGVSSCPR
jgi:hypothetical protein